MRDILLPSNPSGLVLVHPHGHAEPYCVCGEKADPSQAVLEAAQRGGVCIHRFMEAVPGLREAICERDDVRFVAKSDVPGAWPVSMPRDRCMQVIQAVQEQHPHLAPLLIHAASLELLDNHVTAHFKADAAVAAAKLELPPAKAAIQAVLSSVFEQPIVFYVLYHAKRGG